MRNLIRGTRYWTCYATFTCKTVTKKIKTQIMLVPDIRLILVLENWMFRPNHEYSSSQKFPEELSHKNKSLKCEIIDTLILPKQGISS